MVCVHIHSHLVNLSILQKQNLSLPPPHNDHPYGAYLSFGFGIHNRNDDFLENLELYLGVSGKPALGKEAQDMIHRWLSLRLSKGWGSQIRTEAIINLYYDLTYKARILQSQYVDIDILPNLDTALGNANIYVKLGVTFRIGYNLSSTFLFQGIHGENGGANTGRVFSDGLGIYGFIGASGAYVARNMFIREFI